MDLSPKATQVMPTKMAGRLSSIFKALDREPGGSSLSQIVAETGLSKPTAHRLLAALADRGFVYQTLGSRRYCLGWGVASLVNVARRQRMADLLQPSIDLIARATGDTVFATLREWSAAVCVARAEGDFPIKTLILTPGDVRPLQVGAGSLAIMAYLPDEEVAAIIRNNERWLGQYPQFPKHETTKLVERARRDGFALNTGWIADGMNAVGLAMRDSSGSPVAAISLAAIRDRMGAERVPELVEIIRKEIRKLEQALEKEWDAPSACAGDHGGIDA